MPGGARDVCTVERALWLNLTPASRPPAPDLAAKHLHGKVQAARFVDGTPL